MKKVLVVMALLAPFAVMLQCLIRKRMSLNTMKRFLGTTVSR
jgi:Tfp pilus assembly protein PilX